MYRTTGYTYIFLSTLDVHQLYHNVIVISRSIRELETQLEKQQATRKYIAEFLMKREEWKEHERQLMEEENRRILEFSRHQQDREQKRMEEKRVREEANAAMQNKVRELARSMSMYSQGVV